MKGILLVSHGQMAPGMKDSLSMFFGQDIPQLDTLSLTMSMGADEFGAALKEKIDALNTGDGVLVFADVLGGTPFNQAAMLLGDDVDLITGMNLGMLMDYLGTREYEEFVAADLVEKGKAAIVDAKALFSSNNEEEDDD